MSTLAMDKGNWTGDRRKPFPFYNPSLGNIEDYVSQNINLVRKIAYKFRSKTKLAVDVDDLIQEGVIGLMNAYRGYDPEKGAVSTFATYHIQAKIRVYIRDKLPIVRKPAWAHEIISYILKRGMENESPEDIAKTMNRSVETIKNALKCYSIFTIYADAFLDNDDEDSESIMDMFGTSFDESGLLVGEFIGSLTDIEKKIVMMKTLDMTQIEISRVIGVSQVEISRKLKKIKRKAQLYFGDKI
ncbi:sigma-70 family RNA polymerase sigma factor [Paenibacillus sp. UKAQ_18]|nr:sigma-70 family RNA polymerase sigma factor [Paenibacillus sp. UKAQ_18]